MTLIYKICPAALWRAAEAAGRFEGAPVDLADGYIHLSAADQLGETARKHFSGVDGLVLVAVEAERLGAALRWEPSRGGALFPHLYAPLDPKLARSVRPLERDSHGEFRLPEATR